jgi:hypothetical protein
MAKWFILQTQKSLPQSQPIQHRPQLNNNLPLFAPQKNLALEVFVLGFLSPTASFAQSNERIAEHRCYTAHEGRLCDVASRFKN